MKEFMESLETGHVVQLLTGGIASSVAIVSVIIALTSVKRSANIKLNDEILNNFYYPLYKKIRVAFRGNNYLEIENTLKTIQDDLLKNNGVYCSKVLDYLFDELQIAFDECNDEKIKKYSDKIYGLVDSEMSKLKRKLKYPHGITLRTIKYTSNSYKKSLFWYIAFIVSGIVQIVLSWPFESVMRYFANFCILILIIHFAVKLRDLG